jgi:hypothetical protein
MAFTTLNLHFAQQRFQEMARHGIYQKLERLLIKSFGYICKGLVLVHRHLAKPQNDSGQAKRHSQIET